MSAAGWWMHGGHRGAIPYRGIPWWGHRGAMGRPLIHRERGAGIGLQPAGLLAAIPELCLRDCNVFVAKTELVL